MVIMSYVGKLFLKDISSGLRFIVTVELRSFIIIILSWLWTVKEERGTNLIGPNR